MAGGNSRGREDDQLVLRKLASNLDWLAVLVGVPLLSQERPTCRLLPGAAAPNPALDQALTSPTAAEFVLKFPAAARFVPAAASFVSKFPVEPPGFVFVLVECTRRPALAGRLLAASGRLQGKVA